MAAIEGRQVRKVFRDFWGRPKVEALRGVDVSVDDGTIFGLLGPNGAGKSTLIKIMLGHLYCTGGTMFVLGRNPRDVEVKRRIGYLPERTSFYPNLTTLETLRLFGRLLGLPESDIRSRSRELANMVGLEGALDRMVGEFSYGMRKRLGLAQALLNDPDLLLLDEPTAGLDPIGCREIKDLIIMLGRRGKTVMMTSHLLSDVQDVCDTIMILYGGRVQATGAVSDLLARTDEIEIRSPLVSPDVVEQAKQVLERGLSSGSVSVSVPTRSLEEYFVSVVTDAGKRMEGTSGATAGSGVAAYLATGAPPVRPALRPTASPTPLPVPVQSPAPPVRIPPKVETSDPIPVVSSVPVPEPESSVPPTPVPSVPERTEPEGAPDLFSPKKPPERQEVDYATLDSMTRRRR